MQLSELKSSVNNLEDAIITLSGPALAISSVLAIVDLLTGGHILQQYAWFSLAWALCLALTLDFQILALGARSHQIYLSEKKPGRKAVEIGLCILIAVSIAFVSVQMQSIIARVNSFSGMTVEQAASQLGINTIWLIWERSALVLAMIFLSGWFREVKQSVSPETPVETPSTISDDTVQLILSKLAKLDQLEQVVAEQKVTIIQGPVSPPALPVSSETLALNRPQIRIKPGFTSFHQVEVMTGTENEDVPIIQGNEASIQSDEATLEAQIAMLLFSQPGLSSRKVAERLERPHSSVYRIMKQMEQSTKQ